MKTRWLFTVAAVVLLALLGGWLAAVHAREAKARANFFDFRLPSGFSGWVTVKYDVSGATELPFVARGPGGTTIFAIPASGLLETRSSRLNSPHTNKFYWAERGGAVLVGWDPKPGQVRDASTAKCSRFYLSLEAMPDDLPAPPPGCD